MGVLSPVQTHHEVAVHALPRALRAELPRQARSCFIQEPEHTVSGLCRTRVATTPQELAAARIIYLHDDEVQMVTSLIAEANDEIPQVRTAPASMLPAELREQLCPKIFTVLTQDDSQEDTAALLPKTQMYDVIYLAPTGISRADEELVELSIFADRLTGMRSGSVVRRWLKKEQIAHAQPWARSFEHLDSHQRRVTTHLYALQQGETIPVPEQRVEAPVEHHLVPLEYEVFVPANEQEEHSEIGWLQRAIEAIGKFQAHPYTQPDAYWIPPTNLPRLLALLEQDLEWYCALPDREQEPIVYVRYDGHARGYILMIAISATLPVPRDLIRIPYKPAIPTPQSLQKRQVRYVQSSLGTSVA